MRLFPSVYYGCIQCSSGSRCSGGTIQRAACELVPALAESRSQTKKEDADFEWAFKCSKCSCGVHVFAAVLPSLGSIFFGTTGFI